MESKNALAELAEIMSTPVEPAPVNARGLIVLNRNQLEAYQKAGHIIAELAKVKRYDSHGQTYMIYRDEIQEAYEKCYRIAKEEADSGK